VNRVVIEHGWRHICVATLDKLLATACLLRHQITAACAVQLISIDTRHITAAFPGSADAASRLQACAWHALQHFCDGSNIDVPEVIFVDVRKSQASLFFGDLMNDGDPRLSPPAVPLDGDPVSTRHGAQLVGLAQTCTVRVCIVSKLVIPVCIATLRLHLQHIVRNAPHPPGTLERGMDRVGGGRQSSSDELNVQSLMRHGLQIGEVPSGMKDVDDCTQGLSLRLRGHRRRASSLLSGGATQLDFRPLSGGSLAEYSMRPSSDAPVPSAVVLRNWCDGSSLECNLAGREGRPVTLHPGDNLFDFEANPVQEGVHLLDGVEAELKTGMQHSVFIEACVGARDTATAASAAQPFGVALVATADQETLRIGAALQGGSLFESCCQWLGVELVPVHQCLTDVVVSVSLRPSDGDGQLEFARTASTSPEHTAHALREHPQCAFWDCGGSCVPVDVGKEGQLSLPGEVRGISTLWLPVLCRQRSCQPEAVDIGGNVGGVVQAAAAAAGIWEAAVEVSVSYWCSCWRSKHCRLRLPVQVRHSTQGLELIQTLSLV
jgi:hypothetical protein